MKATFSVEAPGGETLTVVSHVEPASSPSRHQVLEFLGPDHQPALTMAWLYGADFSAVAGVPMTVTVGGRPRPTLLKNGQLLVDAASDEPEPLFDDTDVAALTPLGDLLRTVFAPKDQNPFLPKVGADDDALGTISGTAQIGAAVGGGIGLGLGLVGGFAAGGPAGAIAGAGAGASFLGAAGGVIGLEVGIGVVVVQAAYESVTS
jgi:hypothetical protein